MGAQLGAGGVGKAMRKSFYEFWLGGRTQMRTLYLKIRRIETASLMTPPGPASAIATADFSLWSVGSREPLTPLEKKLRQLRTLRIRTTTVAIPRDDGSVYYPEMTTSGWTQEHEHSEGMRPDEVLRLIRSTDSYVEYNPRVGWPGGFLSIQHVDGAKWFRDAVMAGDKYTLRLELRLTRESERWAQQEPQDQRARAFTWRHPLFFNVMGVDIVPR